MKLLFKLVYDRHNQEYARVNRLGVNEASRFYDVVRLRLTAHQTESGERALQTPR
jgi:hypothetical protein